MGCTGGLPWGLETSVAVESTILLDHNQSRLSRLAPAGTRQQVSSSSRQRHLLGSGAIRAVRAGAGEAPVVLWVVPAQLPPSPLCTTHFPAHPLLLSSTFSLLQKEKAQSWESR